MSRWTSALAVVLLQLTAVSGVEAAPPTVIVRCGAFHFVRSTPTGGEMGTTSITFRNAGPTGVTIDRLTIRNFFGDVVHDSGPAIGIPHPLNTDFVPPQDITTVPPGAAYYLSTNHIWGNDGVSGPAGNSQGGAMSVDVEHAGGPKTDLRVASSLRVRERVFVSTPTGLAPVQAGERSRSAAQCADVK